MCKERLSRIEQGFWLSEQVSGKHNHTAVAFLLGKEHDLMALKEALRQIVDETPHLHATIAACEGEPCWMVDEQPVSLPLTECDGAGGSIDEEIRVWSERPFDLQREYPCRFRLVHFGEQTLLLLVLHHVVSEVHTMAVLCKRLSEKYLLPSPKGEESDVKLPSSKGEGLGVRLPSSVDYWNQYVASHDAEDVKPFFTPSYCSGRITTHRFPFGALAGEISSLCREHGVGLFRLLAAAWGVTVQKAFDVKRLWLNYPVSLRSEEQRDAIGVFVNNQLLHIGTDDTTTFAQLVEQVTRDRREARPHQQVSYTETAVGDVLRREWSSVLFNFPLDRRDYALDLDGKHIPYYQDHTTYLPNGLQIDIEGDLSFGIVYANEHFPSFYAGMMADAFLTILGQVVADFDCRIADMVLMPQIDTFNHEVQAPAEAAPSLAAHFRESARQHADLTAVVFGKKEMTYSQLDEWSDRVAALILQHMEQQEPQAAVSPFIGVYALRDIYTIALLLGVWKAGYAYIPLDPENPAERMATILEDARPAMILTDTADVPFATEVLTVSPDSFNTPPLDRRTLAWQEPIYGEPVEPAAALHPTPYAYMMFTSGTTGRPKGTPITQRAVLNLIEGRKEQVPTGPGCREVCFNSIAFDLSVWDMFCPLLSGGTVVFASDEERHDPQLLLQLIRQQQATHILIAPAMLSVMPYEPLPHMRYMSLGGEACPLETIKRWQPTTTMVNAYGPTENTIVCNIHIYPDNDDCATNIGRCLKNVTAYVLDAHHRLLPPGVKGELFLGGEQLTEGYYHRPELNAERFIDNPFATDNERRQGLNSRLYATGDVAYRLDNGEIVYCGRRDSQVKLNGHRIELGEIAACIEQYADVAMAVVRLVERGSRKQLHAFVETASGKLDVPALRSHLERRLPQFMLPAGYTLVPRMPMNINRKVDTKALLKMLELKRELNGDVGAYRIRPRELKEERDEYTPLAAIWHELLGEDVRFSPTDNFLSVGGDSIAVVHMVQAIERQMGVSIPVAEAYNNLTIEKLSRLIAHATEGNADDTPLALKRKGLTPPPHLQSLLLQCLLSEQASKAYNMVLLVPFDTMPDTRLLLQAWNLLRQQQDALRLSFQVGSDGQPLMNVSPYEPVLQLPEEVFADDRQMLQLIGQQLEEPWHFDGSPLCRVVFYRKDDDSQSQLAVYMHHLITDGWSMQLLQQQLAECYLALCQNDVSCLPLPAHSYRSYCMTVAEEETRAEHHSYWKSYLADFEDIRLPYKKSTAADDRSAQIQTCLLPPQLTEEVRRYCEEQRLTPFAFLASAYMVLLARLCRQSGFVVGYPSSGRHDARFADVLGYFVHPLPMRFSETTWTLSFADLCRHTMDDVRQAEEHLLAFSTLCSIAAEQGVTDDTMPLVQAMFTLDEYTTELEIENKGNAQFPLTLSVYRRSDGHWLCHWKYATARLEADTISMLAHSYATLVGNIVHDAGQQVSRLSLLTETERQALTARNNISPLVMPEETIITLFRKQVRRHPHSWLLKDRHETFTYEEADSLSDGIAYSLLHQPAATPQPHNATAPQHVTGLYMNRSARAVLAMIGMMKAGHMYVPLDPTYPAERIRMMVADSDMQTIVCQRELLPVLQDLELGDGLSLSCYEDMVAVPHPEPAPSSPVTPATPAYMIYTSGTTGQPKGVVVSHGNVVALACIGGHAICNPTQDDIVLQFNSYTFDASVNDIFASILNGARLVCVDDEGRHDPDLLFRQMEEEQVTYACIPPALLLNSGKGPTSSLRTLLCGGETPSQQVVDRYTRTTTMLNGYGPSENTVIATINDYRKSGIYTANCIGKQLPGVSCYVLDDHLNLLPPGCPGQLFLGGLQLSAGYHHRPELNDGLFTDNPYVSAEDRARQQNTRLYATGDIVTQDAEGNFYYLGRKDFQVKLHGYRVELREVEETLLRHPGVSQCVVLVKKGDVTDRLAAYVVADASVSADDLRSFAALTLPAYMIPAFWYVSTSLPLTPNGKIDRRKLSTLKEGHLQAAAQPSTPGESAPLTEEERKCRSMVARLLEVAADDIGADDDLISQWSMNSLFVLELVHQLSHRGYQLHPMDVYRQRTVRRITAFITSGQALTPEQTDARLCYLATPDDPQKPLLLIVCGYRYYEVNYADLHNRLKDDYTLLVLESAVELHECRPDKAATAAAMLDEYVRLLRPYIAKRPIAGITGLCIGGDIGLELAIRLDALGLCQPAVFVIDGMADRPSYRGNTGIMEGAGISQETDALRKDYIIAFSKTLHQHYYPGRAHLFMATQFESVEKYTEEEARAFFPVNRDNWQRLQPGIILSYYDRVHMQLIHDPETLAAMKRIIDNELLTSTPHLQNPSSPQE